MVVCKRFDHVCERRRQGLGRIRRGRHYSDREVRLRLQVYSPPTSGSECTRILSYVLRLGATAL